MEEKINYCGVDVSSETLDLYFKNKEGILQHLQVQNSAEGLKKWSRKLGFKHSS